MKNLIRLNINSHLKSKKFKIIFIILLAIPLLHFYLSCFKFYGSTTFNIMPSYDMGIINGIFFRKIIKLYIMTLPLLASFLCSDCYYNDKKNNLDKYIVIKYGRKKYFVSKLISIIILTFISVFFTLCLNEILIYIAFDTNGILATSYNVDNESQFIFSNIKNIFPYAYVIIVIFINATISCIISLISFCISIVSNYNILTINISIFMFYIIHCILFEAFELNNFLIKNYQFGIGDNKGLIFTVLFWISITIYLFRKYKSKDFL